MGCGGSTATKVQTVHIESTRQNSAPTRRQKSASTASVKSYKKEKRSSSRPNSSSSSSSNSSNGSKRKKAVKKEVIDQREERQYDQHLTEDHVVTPVPVHEPIPEPVPNLPEPVPEPHTEDEGTKIDTVLQDDDKDEGVFDEDQPEPDTDVQLVPLKVPEVVSGEYEKKELTLDDLVSHNTTAGWNEWFPYARLVYNCTALLAIVQDRMADDIAKNTVEGDDLTPEKVLRHTYPIFGMTTYGIRSKEVKSVLQPCLVGKLVNIPRDEYLRRLKSDVESVIAEIEEEEEELTEILQDLLAQYTRWLQAFPNVETENKTPASVSGNPNDAEFQLPEGIATDPLLLRKWSDSWELFDTEVPEGGAWSMFDLKLMEDFGDTLSLFAQMVSENRGDEPAFDTTVDGEAGWQVIEQDILKNDITTPEQDEIWKKREGRKHLHDPVRMQKRREKIGQYFLTKYEKEPSWLEKYLNFTSCLEAGWQEFLKVCETFDPSKVPPPKVYNLPPPSDWKATDDMHSNDQSKEGEGGGKERVLRTGSGGTRDDGDDGYDDDFQSNADTATTDPATHNVDDGLKGDPDNAHVNPRSAGQRSGSSDSMKITSDVEKTKSAVRGGSAGSLSSVGSGKHTKGSLEHNEQRKGSNASIISNGSAKRPSSGQNGVVVRRGGSIASMKSNTSEK